MRSSSHTQPRWKSGSWRLAVVGPREQVLQRGLGAVEAGADHGVTSLLPVTCPSRSMISRSSSLMSASMTSSGRGGS